MDTKMQVVTTPQPVVQQEAQRPGTARAGDGSYIGQMALGNGYKEGTEVVFTTRGGRCCLLPSDQV